MAATKGARRSLPKSPREGTSLPLALRLPNAPATFVGRRDELRFLREAARRGPVTVVTGAGGLGKSAVVLVHLHREPEARVRKTLFVTYRACDANEHAALPLVRALARASGEVEVDWNELLGAPEGLTALAIDLADAGDYWVVLDDLHLSGPTRDELLRQLAVYARKGRFFATTRSAPRVDELRGQILELGGLGESELSALGRQLEPTRDAPTLRRLAGMADGSPWRLRQLLLDERRGDIGPPSAMPPSSESSESRESRETGPPSFVRTLARLEVAVPADVAAALSDGAPLPDLADLERMGVVERTGEGVRLHQAARDRLHGGDDPAVEAWSARAASLLATRDDAEMQMQALRLVAAAGDVTSLAAHLEKTFQALLARGFAVALWSLLADLDAPALESWRLRLAIELGDRDVLARVHAPRSADPEVRLSWGAVLAAKGRFADAVPIVEELLPIARAAGDSALAARIVFLHAQCLGNQGQLREARAMLEGAREDELPDVAARVRRDAFAAQLSSLLDEPAQTVAAIESAERDLFALPWPERGRSGVRVARALYNLGRFRDADALLTRLATHEGSGSARFDVGRTLRFLRACLAHDRGDHERALRELAALEKYLGPSSPLRTNVAIARGNVAATAGDVATLEAVVADLGRGELGEHLADERAGLALRASLLARRPLEGDASAAPAKRLFAQMTQLHRLRLDLHLGSVPAPEAAAQLSSLLAVDRLHVEPRVMARLIRAEAHLVVGDAGSARSDVDGASDDATEHELALHALEAAAVRCDVLLVLGDVAGLAKATSGLAEAARRVPSPRLVDAAALADALAAEVVDFGLLERLAGGRARAPEAALRARALLGEDVALGTLDRVVLDAVRARRALRRPRNLGTPVDGRPGWGIDVAIAAVWLPSGARVDLSKQPLLFSLLEHLARAGGAATKEALTLAVWRERSYHPLRHDNRLQAAVRKLRQRIEDDAASPRRLVTTADGYALADGPRFVDVR